ncbi:hypothetical protein SOVF_205160 [Spinacia oleracea]|nr:hypothetical protein SOVF_205160 [Spinacia oleracea]
MQQKPELPTGYLNRETVERRRRGALSLKQFIFLMSTGQQYKESGRWVKHNMTINNQ